MNVKFIIALCSAFFLLCCSKPEEGQFCSGFYYDEQTEFCYSYLSIYPKCNGRSYDPEIQKCSENGSKLLNICNGVAYETSSHYCAEGSVTDKEIFTDSRDGKKYKTVVIGEQTWMAENLNYEAEGSQCYNDDPENCAIYGRLYDWETALDVCPAGWHLPIKTEFLKLSRYDSYDNGFKLKSTSGWKNLPEVKDQWGITPNYASDKFGFSALPGGIVKKDGVSMYIEEHGFWWSSSTTYDYDFLADSFYIGYDIYRSYFESVNKLHKISIRCIKN